MEKYIFFSFWKHVTASDPEILSSTLPTAWLFRVDFWPRGGLGPNTPPLAALVCPPLVRNIYLHTAHLLDAMRWLVAATPPVSSHNESLSRIRRINEADIFPPKREKRSTRLSHQQAKDPVRDAWRAAFWSQDTFSFSRLWVCSPARARVTVSGPEGKLSLPLCLSLPLSVSPSLSLPLAALGHRQHPENFFVFSTLTSLV